MPWITTAHPRGWARADDIRCHLVLEKVVSVIGPLARPCEFDYAAFDLHAVGTDGDGQPWNAGVKRAAWTGRESRGGGWSPRLPEQQWLTQTAFCRDSQQQIQERQTLAH